MQTVAHFPIIMCKVECTLCVQVLSRRRSVEEVLGGTNGRKKRNGDVGLVESIIILGSVFDINWRFIE